MARAPIGDRIRRRRQELSITQTALAAQVGISPSYLNLIEHDRRVIGGALLHRLAEALEVESRSLAGAEEARLIAELIEIAADPALSGVAFQAEDAREIVASSPKSAHVLLAVYRSFRDARNQATLLSERISQDPFLAEASYQILTLITTIRTFSEILQDHGDLTDEQRGRFTGMLVGESEKLTGLATEMFDFLGGKGGRSPRPSPAEEVEDFFSDRSNFFPRIEAMADATLDDLKVDGGASADALARHLARVHDVSIAVAPPEELAPYRHRYDEAERTLSLSAAIPPASARFQMARLIGHLAGTGLFGEIMASGEFSTPEAGRRCRRALATYFSGALLLPYDRMLSTAQELRYDLELLEARFGASFEQICHRLTTLRRPGSQGIPFHFLRTDIAGNISKRFSASGLRLPRYGSACPRWIVYDAFRMPGETVRQAVRLPDGETYLFVARALTKGAGGHGAPRGRHSVMIGCDISHARRMVYGDGLDLGARGVVTPVGVTCRQCPLEGCAQRAFERAPMPNPSMEPDEGVNDRQANHS